MKLRVILASALLSATLLSATARPAAAQYVEYPNWAAMLVYSTEELQTPTLFTRLLAQAFYLENQWLRLAEYYPYFSPQEW